MYSVGAILLLCAAFAHAGTYHDRFKEQYDKMMDPKNGYFSKQGVPFHAVETLIVEAPDYGHETTSEALSYYVWLEAMHGALTKDFTGFNKAWQVMEDNLIPKLQPSRGKYDPTQPGWQWGKDPIGQELINSYGTKDIYLMHWLADADNRYGFGNINGACELGPDVQGASLIINGPGSNWQGIPNPTCDNFTFGGTNGFAWNKKEPEWTYSNAPDADARAVQGAYWASQAASLYGKVDEIKETLDKAAKLGDYLRYSLFDSQFKRVGNCTTANNCPNGEGKESAHYLLSTYLSWGGSMNPEGSTWIGGSSAAIIEYQNPIAAWALSTDQNLKAKSASAAEDWAKALKQQVAFFEYCQSVEGPFVGGVTNSYNGNYETPPAEIANNPFNGLYYYDDGSANWWGGNAWAADRLAQYYYVSHDETTGKVLEKWTSWVIDNIQLNTDSFFVPWSLSTSGIPPNSHANVTFSGTSISLVATTARALIFYGIAAAKMNTVNVGKELLDRLNDNFKDKKGIAFLEYKTDYNNFNTTVYIAESGWTGMYPNNIEINSTSTFLSIRPWYREDPDFPKVEAYLNGGSMPGFNYHRFFDQADYALALAAYAFLVEEN